PPRPPPLPTRRSSDLGVHDRGPDVVHARDGFRHPGAAGADRARHLLGGIRKQLRELTDLVHPLLQVLDDADGLLYGAGLLVSALDRKSTRLNSSHVKI